MRRTDRWRAAGRDLRGAVEGNFDDDSTLYAEMGDVRKSKRSTGKTNKTQPTPPAK